VSDSFVLRTDGGARGNPGPAGIGFVLVSPDGEIVRSGGRFIGVATNNVAEYEALIWGLETALDQGVSRLAVRADSELIVKQVTGCYKVKQDHLRPLHRKGCELLARFAHVDVAHVRREENAEADALANEAMDSRSTVGNGVEPAGSDTLF
jgi:ribonuclease HI